MIAGELDAHEGDSVLCDLKSVPTNTYFYSVSLQFNDASMSSNELELEHFYSEQKAESLLIELLD